MLIVDCSLILFDLLFNDLYSPVETLYLIDSTRVNRIKRVGFSPPIAASNRSYGYDETPIS